MYIWDEIMTYWCIDNLKNGGYSSGMSVQYPYNLPLPPPERVEIEVHASQFH